MKKTVLACCVAAASFSAQAELQPMSEFELHSVTGQAGVDIELDVGINIGSIEWTDTETNGDGDGGTLAIKDIFVGGGGAGRGQVLTTPIAASDRLDNFKLQIDILANGDLFIAGKPKTNGGVVDILVSTGEVTVKSSETAAVQSEAVIIDSMSLFAGATGLDFIVTNATNDLTFRAIMGVEDLDIDLTSMLGMRIENAKIGGKDLVSNSPFPPGVEQSTASFVAVISPEADGVYVDFGGFDAEDNIFDMIMPEIYIGQNSIGSVVLDDVNFQGVDLRISGH